MDENRIAGLDAPHGSVDMKGIEAYNTRYWILLSFSLIGMCQCMNCFTLTSLPSSSEQYFGVTQSQLIVIFNWQPLANTLGALFAAGLYKTLGTQSTARLLAVLAVAGPTIRCIPSLLGIPQSGLGLLCLHLSSIVNGCGGPILNAAPALLSATWFPSHERMTSTGILGTCPILGSMVGFALGPAVVKQYTDLPTLLYVEAIMTAICGALIWVHFPERPPNPPSGAADLRRKAEQEGRETQSDLQIFMKELPAALSNTPFVVICLTVNTLLAIYANAWQTIAPSMFVAAGYTESDANNFLFVITVSSVVGGFASGPLLHRVFGGRLKALEMVTLAAFTLGLTGMTALLPTPWWTEPLFGGVEETVVVAGVEKTFLVANDVVLYAVVIMLGFAQGVSWPPLFEIAAEITYPVSEGTSGGFTGLTNNMGGVIIMYAMPLFSMATMNLILNPLVVGCGIVSCVCFALVPVEMRRQEAENAHLKS
jgi:sugar phosphate permease